MANIYQTETKYINGAFHLNPNRFPSDFAFQLADEKWNTLRFQIGSKTLKDVEATVVNNLNAPLLMGQSVLERFGSITIDNENNKIIFN